MSKLSNNLIIRDYLKSDFAEIAKLWEATDLTNPIRGDNSEIIDKTLDLGGKFLVMVLKSTGMIIGTSWMTYDGRRIHMHHFGILPEYQKQGYAKILLESSLLFVKDKRCQVKLEVHGSNFKAIGLYKKYGFNLLGGYNVYIIRDISKLLS